MWNLDISLLLEQNYLSLRTLHRRKSRHKFFVARFHREHNIWFSRLKLENRYFACLIGTMYPFRDRRSTLFLRVKSAVRQKRQYALNQTLLNFSFDLTLRLTRSTLDFAVRFNRSSFTTWFYITWLSLKVLLQIKRTTAFVESRF